MWLIGQMADSLHPMRGVMDFRLGERLQLIVGSNSSHANIDCMQGKWMQRASASLPRARVPVRAAFHFKD